MGEIRLEDSAPLYEQVRRIIAAEIASGELKPGERVPSEPMLCKRFGVSQITVRRAMRELAREGSIIRRSGLGTFVSERKSPAAGSSGSGRIGLIYAARPDGSLPADAALLAGHLAWAAGDEGLELLPSGGDGIASALELAARRGLSGVVGAPGLGLESGAPGGMRIVAIDPPKSGAVPAEVLLDRSSAGREAASYLIRLGHRAVGFAGCAFPEDERMGGEAREGYHLRGVMESIEIAGLAMAPERCVCATDDGAMAGLISGRRRATGVVCATDAVAAGLVAMAGRTGVRIPDDVSVVSHGGCLSGVPSWPELTVVTYDWKGIAAAAVELLSIGEGVETFTGTVEVHDSTARPSG